MSFFLSPIGNDQAIDANGDPLNGGQIETYLAGSSTPSATYTGSTGAVSQANPIILNALGATASPIWLSSGASYKFVIKDANGVTLRTIDNIQGINDTNISVSEWVDSGLVPTYLSATSFSVPGDQTGTLQIGRRLKTQNTSGLIYSSILTSVFGSGVTTVTVLNDSGVLDAGLSSVGYGLISANNTSAPKSIPSTAAANRKTFGIPDTGPLSGLRNLIINGNGAVNQRGYVSGAATSGANEYTLDRWRVVTSGQNLSWTTSGNGKLMTAPAGGVEQVIEGASIAGGTYVISWTGTATATVDGTPRASGDSFALTAATNCTLRMIGGTFSVVQIESGSVVTESESRPIGLELFLCKRYFQKIVDITLTAYQAASSGIRQFIPISSMRTTPTVSLTQTSILNAGSLAADSPSENGFNIEVVATATGPVSITADADISSEL